MFSVVGENSEGGANEQQAQQQKGRQALTTIQTSNIMSLGFIERYFSHSKSMNYCLAIQLILGRT